MHCKACDVILTEREDARKFSESGDRVSLCNSCITWLPRDIGMEGPDGVEDVDGEFDENTIPWDEEGTDTEYWEEYEE